MNVCVFIAFFVGMVTGIGLYLVALEIGYRRMLREEKEERIRRHIEDLEDTIDDLERCSRRIDFVIEGATNEME